MARGQHRYRHRRLLGEQQIKAKSEAANAPRKAKEGARRETRMVALIKAQLAAGKPLSAAAQSWVAKATGKRFNQLSAEQVAAAVA
jgi:hypothetical protein